MPASKPNSFKTRLTALKKRKPTWGYSGSQLIADELLELLDDLKDSPITPEVGLKSVALLYQADYAFFDRHDDSDGSIGYVFKVKAAHVFSYFAYKCANKKSVIDLVLELNQTDDYGVRASLFAEMIGYLSDAELQDAVDRLWALSRAPKSQNQTTGLNYDNWLQAIKTIAKQTSNPELYATTCFTPDGKPISNGASIELAQVFVASGDFEGALNSLAHLPIEESFIADERDKLLIKIYRRLGDDKRLVETLWRSFRRELDPEVFETLVGELGSDNREQLIDEEISLIFADSKYNINSSFFLIEIERPFEAERYIIEKRDTIDGIYYSNLLPLADRLLSHNLLVGVSLIYRALLDSILRRAKAAIYHFGVNYLRRLDWLATEINDWKGVESHVQYVDRLREKHKLKYRFWELYQ